MSRFNCLFDAVGQQVGCNGEILRQQTVQIMTQNKSQLAAAFYDIDFLRQNHSEALFEGGAKKPKGPRQPFGDKHIAMNQHQIGDDDFPSEPSDQNNIQTDNRYTIEGRQVPINTIIQRMKANHFETKIKEAM